MLGFCKLLRCSMRAAFLSRGGRDRQKSRPRQAATAGPEAVPTAGWRGRRCWRPEQNVLSGDANALPPWSPCIGKMLSGKDFIFLFFWTQKYKKGFLVISKLLPVESIVVFQETKLSETTKTCSAGGKAIKITSSPEGN